MVTTAKRNAFIGLVLGAVTLLALSGLAFLVWAALQVQRQLSLIRSLSEME